MTVILRSLMAGPDGVFAAGDRATLSAERERSLVEGGYAVYVAPPAAEAAVALPPEVAIAPAVMETATLPPVTTRRRK